MKDLVDFAFLLLQVLTLGSPDEDPDEDHQDQDQDLDNDVAPGIEGRLEQASLQEFARSVTKRRSIFLTSFLKVQCQSFLVIRVSLASSKLRYTLQQLCSQEWVSERCLQSPDGLLKNGALVDSMLNIKQAQKLLRLICMPPYSRGKQVRRIDTYN